MESVLKNVLCKASYDLLLHVTPVGTVLKNDIVTAKYSCRLRVNLAAICVMVEADALIQRGAVEL